MGQQQQEIVAGSALRRIILVLAVAAVVATLMAAMAAPAMAKNNRVPGTNGPPPASFGPSTNDSSTAFHGDVADGVEKTCVEHFKDGQTTKLTGAGAPLGC